MSDIIAIGNINTLINRTDRGFMTTQLKVKDILKIYLIDKTVNRDLGYHRIPKLVKYFDSVDNEIGIFLPAIVLSFRSDPSSCYIKEQSVLLIHENEKLAVIDGQHRIKGLEQFLNKSNISPEKKEKIKNSYLTVQIYFGLSTENERELFTDINTNAKRVSMSLITKYDLRDILNILTTDLYNNNEILQNVGIEFNKSRLVRPGNIIFTTSVRLKKFISLMLFEKESLNKIQEKQIKSQYDDLLPFLNKVFSTLFSILPNDPGDVTKYVLGHEPMQNAIALYLNKAIITDNQNEITWLETWRDGVNKLGNINWSVKNRDWYPYMLTARKNTKYEYKAFIETSTSDLIEIIIRKTI